MSFNTNFSEGEPSIELSDQFEKTLLKTLTPMITGTIGGLAFSLALSALTRGGDETITDSIIRNSQNLQTLWWTLVGAIPSAGIGVHISHEGPTNNDQVL